MAAWLTPHHIYLWTHSKHIGFLKSRNINNKGGTSATVYSEVEEMLLLVMMAQGVFEKWQRERERLRLNWQALLLHYKQEWNNYEPLLTHSTAVWLMTITIMGKTKHAYVCECELNWLCRLRRGRRQGTSLAHCWRHTVRLAQGTRHPAALQAERDRADRWADWDSV